MENGFLMAVSAALSKQTAAELTACNERTVRYGLLLTPEDAAALIAQRGEALRNAGRVEFGSGMLQRLILTFCSSPYLTQSGYNETLHELIELFYYFKNECIDLISDDELLDWMRYYYDNTCHGSLELLRGRELERMAREIREGCFDFRIPQTGGSGEEEEEDDA